MKRRVEDLTDAECQILFERLDLETKRRLIGAVNQNGDAVAVYTAPTLYRDVVSIIANHLPSDSWGLEVWGRLRQSSSLFHRALPIFPALRQLHDIFASDSCDADWVRAAKASKSLCQEMFFACVKRVILTAYAMMETHIQQWHENPPAPEVITRIDGTRHEIQPTAPQNYSLKNMLSELTAFTAMNVDADVFRTRFWFKLLGFQVFYPYGYICGETGKNAHGNIFVADEWQALLILHTRYFHHVSFRTFPEMSKAQRVRFKTQKLQLAAIRK
jgi:hypothetical protein